MSNRTLAIDDRIYDYLLSVSLRESALLQRLREACPGRIAVWPFETGPAPVHVVEIWPSLIDPVVAASGVAIRDRAQVRFLTRALASLPVNLLAAMMAVEAPEEGWILGLGHERDLQEAACRS